MMRRLPSLSPAPRRPHRPGRLLLWLALAGLSAHAEPPKLETLFPAGGQAGSSFVVTATGRLDDGVRLWSASPELIFAPSGKKREWQATLTGAARPGPHLVYALGADGASDALWFSVGTLPDLAEAEPNDDAGKPQKLAKLPVCINGRLDKSGDVDGFQVRLEAGQTLVALVEAYALGSPVDMLAHVLDPQGVRVHTASDGRNLDPQVIYQAPRAGDYTVQLAGFVHPPAADVRFAGGASSIYRLHLSAGPVVTGIYPAAVLAQGKTEIELRGYNLDPKKLRHTIENPAPAARSGELVALQVPGAPLPVQALVTAAAAQLEREPNAEPAQATPIRPGTAAGRIADKADIDRFSLVLKKGKRLQARLWSKDLGLPLDATLSIEGPDGKSLALASDQGEQPDPLVQWTAAADGPHQILVADQFHRGGAAHEYVLEVGPPLPGVQVTLPAPQKLSLERGKTASLKVGVKLLNGFKEALVLRAAGLPPGVHAAEVAVPEKGGEVEIKFQAAANAPAGVQAVTLAAWTRTEPARQQPAEYPLRGENGRGTSLLDRAQAVWLTVK